MTQDVAAQLHAVASGNKGAFASLYRQLQPALLRYAGALLAGDIAAAEDVVDDALIAVWQNANTYSGQGSAIGWIRRIVRNKVVDWLRKQCRQPQALPHHADAFVDAPDPDPDPECIAQTTSEAAQLRSALGLLSVEHREAVWLCYFEDLPLAEIAAMVGCPENTVKTRLFHARKMLRESGLLERC